MSLYVGGGLFILSDFINQEVDPTLFIAPFKQIKMLIIVFNKWLITQK